MALGTGNISLSQVKTELGLGATTSLGACFAAANAYGFNPTYEGSKNSLSNFKGYNHSTVLTSKSLGYSNGSGALACTDFSSSPSTFYLDATTLGAATKAYTSAAGTTHAANGYYSDGTNYRLKSINLFGSASSC